MVAAQGGRQQQQGVKETVPAGTETTAQTLVEQHQELGSRVGSSRGGSSRGGSSRGGGSRGSAVAGVRSGGGTGDGDADGSLEDEAAVGSIHHILKTAFKELYGGGAGGKEGRKGQVSAAGAVGERQGESAGASGSESVDPSTAPDTTGEAGNLAGKDGSFSSSASTTAAAGTRTGGGTRGKRKSAGREIAGGAEEVNPSVENPAEGMEGNVPEGTEIEGVEETVVGEEVLLEFTNGVPGAGQGGERNIKEGETSEDAASIEERILSIDADLRDRQALARGLRSYTLAQRIQAQEHDTQAFEALKKQGIIVGAHIPMGPSGLVLDRSAIDAFQGFAVSLLDAAELARANQEAGLRHSGNLPWNQSVKREPHVEGGDARFEPPGYLKHTATNTTREALALKRSFGRRGDKGMKQQQKHQQTLQHMEENALEGNFAQHGKVAVPDDEEGAGTASGVWRDQGITEDDTTDDDSVKGGSAKLEQGRRKAVRKAAQRDADAAVMTRMQRKLRFRRNPRCDLESRWHEQMLTERPATTTPTTTATALQATACDQSAEKMAARRKTLSKTDLLSLRPPQGALEGENGYFLATPAVVEYFDYCVGKTFTAELTLRNISCLKRSFMLLPPATEYFSLAKVIYPSSEIDPASGVVTGSGELAPGVGAKVLVDFTPDSLGEYHDLISVVTEVGTFEVPIFAHRRRPCLSLPSSGVLDCGGCLLGESKTLRFRVKNTGGLVRFRLFPAAVAAVAASPADMEQEHPREENSAEGMTGCGHASGGYSNDELSAGVGGLRIDTDETEETVGLQDDGGLCAGVRVVDFDGPDFDPEGNNGRLENAPFCVFPTDFSIGEGETVFVNVEYLPSKVGPHEARFVMVQDNCEEMELCVSALCEQVSLRISSIDGTPVPAWTPSTSPLLQDQRAAAPLPTVISHLLFEPTLLASTGRRRFTLRNDTTGDLPVRWEISEMLTMQQENQEQQALKGYGTRFAPARAGGSSCLPKVCNAVTKMADPRQQRMRHAAGATILAGADNTVAAAGVGAGRGQAVGAEATRRTSRLKAQASAASAVSPMLRNIDGRDGKNCADLESSCLGLAASSPPSPSAIDATVVLPAERGESGVVAAAAAGASARVPDTGPFGIFPEFAVVPAQGEVVFEVTFSPTGLRESRFEAVAVVKGVPAAALAYHNPSGALVDAKIPSSEETTVDLGQGETSDGGSADGRAVVDGNAADVEGGGSDGGSVGTGSSRLFLRSLDPDGKGYFSRDAAIDGLRGMIPLLRDASATFQNPSPSPAEQQDQIAGLVEEAANRLEPTEDTSASGGFTEDAFVTVSGAVSAMGVELRDRISHALAGNSLEELVKHERMDMPGLQVELRGAGEPARLSLRPAMLQTPGENLPYGQPYVLEFEVCNASEAPAEFEFDLRRLTVSAWGNDPLGAAVSQTGGGGTPLGGGGGDGRRSGCGSGSGGICSCDVQVSPGKAVAPPAGSIRCTVTLTPFCVGPRTVSLPISAPTAAPPELGEELCLRVGFVGSGGAARIEAAEVDLGLIAVGTAQSGEVRLRNVGTVPFAFAMAQAAAAASTVAESAAQESRTASILRDLLLSQQHQQQQKQHQEQQRQEDNQRDNRLGQAVPFASAATNTAATSQRHPEDDGNDQALARVFGPPPTPPPQPPVADASSSMTKHASAEGLLQRRNSEGSVGSSDSFSVSRDGCKLSFEPALGELAPGRSTAITVSCEGGRLPERFRTAARALLQSCDGRGVAFGSEYVAVRAEIQEPTVYISAAEVDVGIAYLGVPVTRQLKMVNLSNLEVRDVNLRYTARQSGPIDEVYACRVFGMALPLGFAISGKNRGPTLSFGLVADGEKAPRPIQRPHLPQYVGEEPLPEPEPAPPLEFGKVDLRGRKTLIVFIRNLSAISTPFAVKVRKYACTPCPPRLKISNMSYSALQRVVSNPRALRGYLDDKDGGGGGPEGGKHDGKHGESGGYRGSKHPGVDHEATEAFFSRDGRARTKAQIDQREDCFVLKEGLGAAFLVEPASGTLPPWGVATVAVTVFNDTPGRYTDKVDITFTGAPMASLPIKVVVEGSPLSLKREALGLDLSGPEPLLSFGEVFVHGGKTFRVIKIKNEGTLPAMLTWGMQDANVDAKEAAKKVDVFIKLVASSDNSGGGWSADVSVSYRQPKPFESPFVVQPRQGVVEPRSDGAFKVILPEHHEGEMAARLVADAYWMPPPMPGDASSSSGGHSAVVDGDSAMSGRRPNAKDGGRGGGGGGGGDIPRMVGGDPQTGQGQGSGKAEGEGGVSGGGETAALSPLSLGGGSPHPTPATVIAATGDDSAGKYQTASVSKSAFSVGQAGTEEKTVDHATDSPTPLHETMSVSTVSSSTTANTRATSKVGGCATREPPGDSGGGSGASSLAAAATVQIAAKTLVNKTINRKHGRTTTGAVVLKAAAWGIEPRLALDKKTHAALQQDSGGGGGGGAHGGNLGVGQQFLKFEAWSTRASASSSPWAAHPTLRRQISLSNPLTIPVSFRVDTHGPFAINPAPSRKRLHNGKSATHKYCGGGSSTDSGTESRYRGGLVGVGRSPKRRRAAGGHAADVSDATGTTVAAAPAPVSRKPAKNHRREGREEVLLPGQNLQLELVFMPSRSPEMSESLVSSFSPGTEDIPKLVLRASGELRIAFSTGHVQTIWLRGEVLRPMITVAPPNHTFGTIHTERDGHATLFLGNPTFADAEWSLSHVPAPPPKKRVSHTYTANNKSTGASASADVVTGTMAGKGGTDASTAAGSGSSLGKLGGRRTPADSSSSVRGASRGRSRNGAEGGGRLKTLVVDDPSVFVFGEEAGVIAGVKLPLKSSAACLPEDWNRLELKAPSGPRQTSPFFDGRAGEDPACESSTHSRNQGWMHQFLQPVMDILSAKYSAVGIMEQWNASMQLFQATLELPGMDWLVAFETGGGWDDNITGLVVFSELLSSLLELVAELKYDVTEAEDADPPISRLVSAYYYCMAYPTDQLCATKARGADSEDLEGFARHWGNYGLMQFVLAFVKPEDIVPDEKTWADSPKTSTCLRPYVRGNRKPQGCPGWYRLKLFVERRSMCTGQAGEESECGSTPHSLSQEWMHQFLRPVMDILSEKYTAVGIMEQWNTSMRLFQATLELPGMDWLAAFKAEGTANALSAHQRAREETLRRAMRDSNIRELLWLDILLYDHAVNVFNKQIEDLA
eukprot:g10191.t1